MRVYRIDVSQVSAGSLSFGDLIDLSEATGVEPEEMQSIIGGAGKGAKRMRLLCGLAWVVARRDEPALTYADILAGQVEIIGKLDPRQERAEAKRAERMAGLVLTTGLPPSEVRRLSVAEVQAISKARAG
jgi:hypothetical protein